MKKEEAIIRIVGKIDLEYDGIVDQQKVRSIIEEVLYDYELVSTSRELVIVNDMHDKIMLYLATRKIDGLAKRTLEAYSRHLNRFAHYMRKNIEDINAMDIRMYLASYSKTGVKNTTLATEINYLRGFFKWLKSEEYIDKNPMDKIKTIKVEKRLRDALTIEELEKIRDACETYRQRALVEFFYSTGCRLEEVEKLNKEDIDWQNLKLKVIGKGNKQRVVYLSPKAKVYIQKYLMSRLDTCEALFVTERNPISRLGRRSIQREFNKLANLAALSRRVYPHLMRHTTATNLLNGGADLVTVQQVLGHQDPSTTLVYAKISDKNVEHEYRKNMIQ
ncbi:tyrosine-type recombinase/integrase [Natronincola ferrireducens]|uniref:Integrase/recombinase XerD n=1 Tax=Natronincola ferrireducens TaxID=393762 RepID=A0A1G9I741_9FIRM|nr:tyrosine-type recombinase/integrase [Natronincola ferrireducens]SDL21049.1 integrase/recombinase XerD [Natronincola ferrireducens]